MTEPQDMWCPHEDVRNVSIRLQKMANRLEDFDLQSPLLSKAASMLAHLSRQVHKLEAERQKGENP